jgi:hypothetical protein
VWTSHLWEFNNRYGLTVHQEDKPWFLPQQENDLFIMEALTNLPAATTKCLHGAQCCCLYLQVTTLANITNSAGTQLAEWVQTHGTPSPCEDKQRYDTPIKRNLAQQFGMTSFSSCNWPLQKVQTTNFDNC